MVIFIDHRKPNSFGSIEGMQANSVLLGGNKFDSKYTISWKSENNDYSLIDKHFFYMKNPRTSSEAEEPYLIFRNNNPNNPHKLLSLPSDHKINFFRFIKDD
jgi:hypothetical protein